VRVSLLFLNIESKSCLIFVTLLVFLNGCANNTPEVIETSEHFTSRIDESGQIQFAFGILWQNNQLDSAFVGSENTVPRRQDKNNSPEHTMRHENRFSQQANNQTKLELEDLAALSLAKKLKDKSLCIKGYTVEQVIWENQRIRLMGFCL
jgi:hypothetical protein